MSPHPASRPHGFFCWGFGPRSSSLTPGEPRLRPRLGQMLGTVGWREVLVTQPCLHSEYISWNGGSVYLLLSNLRIDTHHHHKIVGTSVPFPVGCLLSQLRISTNELLNHLAGWRLLCICDQCRLILCEPSQANSFHCDTTIFTFSAWHEDCLQIVQCMQHCTQSRLGGANTMFCRDHCYTHLYSCIFLSHIPNRC